MVFKCKMCGGELDVGERASVGTCRYCGTRQTLPRLDDDKRANLYERANHFRRQNDFDKATGIYESILNEDKTDAEAYWSLVLCKYGVEYVEDPATKRRMPTCNRAQYASVLADGDYKQALANADASQRSLYEEEARAIDAIQKGILEISGKEEPFDIFICYKESDENGRRTPDSVLAQDMYHQLTNEGFKVFFSRITLEDKLGTAYEPYIFAALQSSPVMVVVGTKPEYFGAVWVKNEWSRYLGMIKGGVKKILIPAYKDMDPYNLPEEFSHLQAQDMGKLGFMQDLVRGIKKILSSSKPQPDAPAAAVAAPSQGGSSAALMQRAFIELEDGNWDKADGLLEQVLNAEPQNAKAYVGKVMAAFGIPVEDRLPEARSSLTENGEFQKALRFADGGLRARLQEYANANAEYIERARKQAIFDAATATAKTLETVQQNVEALVAFAKACRRVVDQLDTIRDFPGTDDLRQEMQGRAAKADSMAAEIRRKTQRSKRIKSLVKLGIVAVIVFGISYQFFIKEAIVRAKIEKNQKQEQMQAKADADKQAAIDKQAAEKQAAEKKKAAAELAATRKKLAAERAATEKANAGKYAAAEALWDAGSYEEASTAFNEIGGYKFGKYRWRILAIDGDKALLITESVIESRPFNDKDEVVTWENCSLRAYLNGDFYRSKFTDDERARIVTAKLKNPRVASYGGKDTRDNVFLLDADAAKKYFRDFPEDKKIPEGGFKTFEESAVWFKENGDRVALDANGLNSDWWLRTLKLVSADMGAMIMNVKLPKGEIPNSGDMVTLKKGVRPAVWIKVKA